MFYTSICISTHYVIAFLDPPRPTGVGDAVDVLLTTLVLQKKYTQ